jgi:eukaryotic-like serine/threonine-protein kinase
VDLATGAVFAERYRLEQHLGSGGMGVVWAARCTDTGESVALKFMRTDDDGDSSRRRFLREARAASSIRHPNVVSILEVLDLSDAPVIVMERLSGESLADRLARDGPMELSEAAALLLPVVSAVSAAHALGIVHRDLKPDNIFIAKGDGGATTKVLDFGIAKILGSHAAAAATAHATTTGAVLGTPVYMPPEQVFGEKDIDHRADIWSLGMILYETLTGVLPTRADNVGQIIKLILTRDDWRLDEVAPDLPTDVVDLVRRMLSRARERRPPLTEVARVLTRYSGGVTVRVESRPPGGPNLALESTVQAPPRSPAGVSRVPPPVIVRGRVPAVAALVVLGLAGATWLVVGRGSPEPEVVSLPGSPPSVVAAPSMAPPEAPPPQITEPEAPAELARDPAPPTPSAAAVPVEPVVRRTSRPRPRVEPLPPAPEARPAPESPQGSSLQTAVVDEPPF